METFNILFVCTGNAARSVMAEAMFKSKLKANEVNNIEVASAGILTIENLPASRRVQSALKSYGLSVLQHRSRQVQEADVLWADLIVGFEILHIEYMRRTFAAAAKKVGTLKMLTKMLAKKMFVNIEELNGESDFSPEGRIKKIEALDLSSVLYSEEDLEVRDPDSGGDIEMKACADEVSMLIEDFFRFE